MGLPSTGAISLNQIHVEAGGASGTQASINDADIRGIIGKASGATSSFSEFRGKSATIPDASTAGRRKANGDLLEVAAYAIKGSGDADAEACVEFQLRKITNGFEVRVRHVPVTGVDNDGNGPLFYTNAGNSSSLTSSFRRVLVVTGTELDSYKMNWNLVSGYMDSSPTTRYTDSNLVASEDVFYSNSVRYKVFRIYAYAPQNGYNTRPGIIDMTFYGRKSGVPDRELGTYRIDLKATAESSSEIAIT
ncbi:hypothetical protein BZG00_15685 [Salinivibrio kushneri]|uniref:Uncharacterized protein n=2 Tax=Pseudomonadota TaxID=1224 RepID=A0A922NZ66_9HYPH|nr:MULTISPECIES: hypothetical protein [Pseudomonadota]YP_008125990.1 hypothetical protein M610_gp019 [Alteromonas phage vB_AmaP_AD45-P1]AGM46956.1 hypothetical protein AD45P3_00090 [Alteromonas phage vB_AmaP_AD45-P3]AGM47073.1 hypothetical protein AD45P4_00090 [Alteromonas phage vB_AmaP_AD45-P4]AGM47189.1 hypothetical protein AD45P2_00090 [Alteromonas phage vB_AmaP_AD45-P2]AGM46837.1 hypothetical protein AD45P1_00095 [Alteromonas phage vB_AmaP_AD45-P1]KEQ05572.1 hypothetical protein GV68_0856